MKKSFFRFLVFLLCLSLLPVFVLGESAEIHLSDFSACSDIPTLLEAADQALAAGMDPKTVSDEMLALADDGNFLTGLQYVAENIAAAGSESTTALQTFCTSGRRIQADSEDVNELDSANTSPYEVPAVSDALRELLANSGAQYCLRPYIWPESAFKDSFKVAWKQFKPKSPRPGYCCVIITDSSEATPGVSWEGGDLPVSVITEEIHLLKCRMEENGIVFTGNPNLASSFLVFDISFPFYAVYGQEDQVKGYHCSLGMSWLENPSQKPVAEIKVTNKLADTIYRWSNGIAYADPPQLYADSAYDSFLNKVKTSVATAKASQSSNRRITSANAGRVLNDLLLQEAGNTKDAWQKAIYEGGAWNIVLSEDSVTFTLRGWQPDVKTLGAYAKASDGAAWLNAVLENASKDDLEIELPLQDGQIPKAAMTKLKGTVSKAAASAKQAFSGKDFQTALKDRLFPAPLAAAQIKSASELISLDKISVPFRTWLDSRTDSIPDSAWAALLAVRKNLALDVSKGPHEIVLNYTDTLEPEELLQKASYAALESVAAMPVSARPDREGLQQLFSEKLAEEALNRKNQGNKKTSMAFDLDELSGGGVPLSVSGWLDRFSYTDTLNSLESTMAVLPDTPLQEMPKNGWLSGSKKGTRVNVKVSFDSQPTYFVMRDASTNQITVTAFIHPGKTVALNVPSGFYNLAWCSGRFWFGYDTLFGSLGSYSKSESVEIMNAQYYHTFTLEAAENGDVSFWNADPDDFR